MDLIALVFRLFINSDCACQDVIMLESKREELEADTEAVDGDRKCSGEQ